MPVFGAYEGLTFFDQWLHSVHVMLCALATLIACVPLLTEKGSLEHKFAGRIYLPISLLALVMASFLAWHERSLVLFCFNSFCAYLLLSGWRATREQGPPQLIDWMIPGTLLLLSTGVTLHAMIFDQGMRSFYLLFFALNGFFLCGRDWGHLRQRLQKTGKAPEWLGRHIAGMVGSVLANFSVVVLTLLPLWLHWLWPVTLILAAAYFINKEEKKKRQLRKAMATVLKPKFRTPSHRNNDDEDNFRKAA